MKLNIVIVAAALSLAACASLDKPVSSGSGAEVYGSPDAIGEAIQVPSTLPSGKINPGRVSNTPTTFASPAAQMAATHASNGRDSLAQGDTESAEYSFNQALEVNPFDPIALNNLAVVKAERSQFYSSLGLLERAAKLAPSNAEIAANLARMRLYVAESATVGVETLSELPSVEGLPPAPPTLWDGSQPLTGATAGYYTSTSCTGARGGQATGAACSAVPVSTK